MGLIACAWANPSGTSELEEGLQLLGCTSFENIGSALGRYALAAHANSGTQRTFTYTPLPSPQVIERFKDPSSAYYIATDYPFEQEGVTVLQWFNLQWGLMHHVETAHGMFMERDQIVDIFLGRITRWNTPEFLAQNPVLELPDEEIRMVIRKGRCGTNYILSSILSKFSDEWAERFGVVYEWPQELLDLYPSVVLVDSSKEVLDAIINYHFSLSFVAISDIFPSRDVAHLIVTRNARGQISEPGFDVDFSIGHEDVFDLDVDYAWPMVSRLYLAVRDDYHFEDVAHCSRLREAMAMMQVMSSNFVPAHIVRQYRGSTVSLEERRNTPLPDISCNGQPLSAFELPLEMSVKLFVDDEDEDEDLLAEDVYVQLYVPEREPFFDSLGHTIEEDEADSLELEELDLGQVSETHYLDEEGVSVDAAQESDAAYGSDEVEHVAADDHAHKREILANGLVSSAGRHSPQLLLLALCCLLAVGVQLPRLPTERVHGRHLLCALMGVSLAVLLTVPAASAQSSQAQPELLIAVLSDITGPNANQAAEEYSAIRLATEIINESSDFLPDTKIVLFPYEISEFGLGASGGAIEGIIQGADFLVGGRTPAQVEAIARLGSVYGIPYVSYTSSSEVLTPDLYPTFSRIVPSRGTEAQAAAALLEKLHLSEYKVVVIVGSDEDAIRAELEFEAAAEEYRYFVEATFTVKDDVSEADAIALMLAVRETLGRVIVTFVDGKDLKTLMKAADQMGLVSPQYVWLGNSRSLSTDLLAVRTDDGSVVGEDEEMRRLIQGFLAFGPRHGWGEGYDQFLDRWLQLDPFEYSGGGSRLSSRYTVYAYDTIFLIARAYDELIRSLETYRTRNLVLDALRNVEFVGASGDVGLHGDATNHGQVGIFNYVPTTLTGQRGFREVGHFIGGSGEHSAAVDHMGEAIEPDEYGIVMRHNIVWFDGTTDIPDLDVRKPLHYWSCEDKEFKTDETGKSVRLDEPGRDAENIADFYECDGYIDCYNMSDEWACSASLPVGFIVVGIIVAIWLLLCILLAISVLVLALVPAAKQARISKASPTLLILQVIACAFIAISVFSVFGQPHDVSCAFQLWMMVLPLSLLVGAIAIKPVATFYHFKFPTHRQLKGIEMVVVALLHCIPTLLITAFWAIIATPSATLEERDGREHHVCGSNGFTGTAGMIVCLVLILVYEGLVLLAGAVCGTMSRKVVIAFNESRLLTTAIYNVALAGAVAIPVYFAIFDNNVGRWSVMVGALLYVSMSTLVIIFVPKFYGLLFVDPGKKRQAQEIRAKTGDDENGMF